MRKLHFLIIIMIGGFIFNGMAFSATNLSQTQISQLYVSIFGRASEGSGNAYWSAEQHDMSTAANTMLNTEAAKGYFGTGMNDNAAFVAHIYTQTFGKSYGDDPGGQDYWVSELASGKSKGEMIAALISAAQDPANSGPAQDRFNNQVSVSNYCADNIPLYKNNLATFVGFIENVTDTTASVTSATQLIDSESSNHTAEWTYMVYIAGDNNLSPAAVGDINEMEKVGSSSKVNVVVQTEYSSKHSPEMPPNTYRAKIIKDDDINSISTPMTDIGNQDMGARSTLTDFIRWATLTYPANHYALVLWDHGSGWKESKQTGGLIKGALQDETAGSYMSLPDLAGAVRDSGLKPDIINFDACLMGMYEVAYEFKGLADYMIFSEETEPGEGDPYDTILQKLVDTPGMSSIDLAKTTTSEYKVFYEKNSRGAVTKSAIDMTQIGLLDDQLGTLSNHMITDIATERPNIQAARDNSIKYALPENHDLGSFLDRLAENTSNQEIIDQTAAIKNTLDNAIVSNVVYDPDSKISLSCGLAIFLPQRGQVTDEDLSKYAQLAINNSRSSENSWGGFVNQLVTGGTSPGQALETKPGNFVVWLEWDTDADLDLVVWEPDGTFAAPYIGATSPNGFLSEDSSTSGLSVESYAANDQVEVGTYNILVEYGEDGPLTTGSTTASIYIRDTEAGDQDFDQTPT